MAKALFVTGTGTDVGKTYISALMSKALREAGLDAAYYKAAVSGNVRRPDGEGNPKEGQKRLSPGRGGSENELHKVLLSMRRDFIPHPVSTVPGYMRRGRGARGSCNRSAHGQLPWNFPW